MLLALAALVSTAQGFSNALNYSRDFQWSPSVLLWERINPYTYYLEGNLNNRIILSQAPNYAQLTYVLLFPFTLMGWDLTKIVWAITNIAFAVAAIIIICRNARLSRQENILILFMFLCSTPFRNTLENGQHAILVLLLLCTLLYKRGKVLVSLAVGVSYIKYSFMPPIIVYIGMRDGIKSAIASLVPCGLGWIVFSLILEVNPLETLSLPLRVSFGSVGQGVADMMTIVGLMLGNRPQYFPQVWVILIPLLFSVAFAWYAVAVEGSSLFKFAFVTMACLITFKHLAYDFVLMLPAFIYAYSHRKLNAAKLAIGLISINWYGLRLISSLTIKPEFLIIYNFASGLALLFLIAKINRQIKININ